MGYEHGGVEAFQTLAAVGKSSSIWKAALERQTAESATTDVNNHGGSANLLMLGAEYEFSKRGLLYASVDTVLNSANSHFSVEATNHNPRVGKMGIHASIARAVSHRREEPSKAWMRKSGYAMVNTR